MKDNPYVQLAEVELKIAALMAEDHDTFSPRLRALQAKRVKIAAKTTPNIAEMTMLELIEERSGLRAFIKKCERNPLLCDATLSMLKRRNLALKDAIEHRRQTEQV